MSIKRKLWITILVVITMLSLVSCTTFRESEADPATTSLDKEGYTVVSHANLSSLNMTFAYKYNGEKDIDIKVTAPTDHTQWVGVGFNDKAKMADADFKVGHWPNSNYLSSIVDDKKSEGRSAPSDDTIDSLMTSEMSFSSSTTTIKFTMPLADDGNGHDHTLVKGNSLIVLLAYGPYSGQMKKHTRFSSFEFQLALD